MTSLQLRDYHILLTNGQHILESIENIQRLEEIIRIYKRDFISKITFYFHDSHHKYHNLTLVPCQDSNKFIVEFFYYYNKNYVRIDLSLNDQIHDFNTVINCINQTDGLGAILGKYIINPSYKQ